MQGFIININKARDEDLIVSILTHKKIKTTYRFYGSRHSIINLGYKIDFETNQSTKTSLLQLRNVLHLAQSWNMENGRFYIWQQFIKLFYLHLKDVEDIDEFYFNILDNASKNWQKQNPKRITIESYLELLEFEGRLHELDYCFVCEKKISNKVALARAFLPSHTECIHDQGFDIFDIKTLFKTKVSFHLDDKIIDDLFDILCKGL